MAVDTNNKFEIRASAKLGPEKNIFYKKLENYKEVGFDYLENMGPELELIVLEPTKKEEVMEVLEGLRPVLDEARYLVVTLMSLEDDYIDNFLAQYHYEFHSLIGWDTHYGFGIFRNRKRL